jgi:hypothetical protein
MEEPKTAKEAHEVLYDGADLLVTLRDQSRRTVKVRKISRKDFPAFAAGWGNEEAEAAFYLGEEKLVQELSDESFDAVMEEGRRLNFTLFSNWFKRQYQKLSLLKSDGLVETVLAAIEQNPQLKKLVGSTSG